MTTAEMKARDASCVMQTYGRFDVAIDRGCGATLYSPEGMKYIDFSSGIGVNSLGYGDEGWAGVVYEQAKKLQHISNLFYTEPYIALAETLTYRSGMKNVFFANSGAESNEGMIKLARKYSFDKYGAGRSRIVTLRQSFHGRTVTTLAATGQDVFHNYFFPFTEGFDYAIANDMESVKATVTDETCAVMMELIQGEGGVLPLAHDFVEQVAELCREKDLLLLIDEVQTGVGRTGSLFAFMQYGIEPDVVSFAKGIAGGLPFGGFMANEKCAGVLTAGTHATTFGGNPVCAAAAKYVLGRLDEEALKSVREKGEYIRDTVSSWGLGCVSGIRGMGLMIGVGLREGVSHKAMAQKCMDNGLLILTAGSDTLRMLPPLTITREEIDAGLNILKNVLEGAK